MTSQITPSSPPPPNSSSSQHIKGHHPSSSASASVSASSSTAYNTPLPSISTLTTHLSSSHDPTRKMAAFKLQSAVGDPGFADAFILEGGLPKLRLLVLGAHGNTLAYALNAWARLLELDRGWEGVDGEVVAKVVELVVTHPLVNILRGAMSILVAVVSHPVNSNRASQMPDAQKQQRQMSDKSPVVGNTPSTLLAGSGQSQFGLRALKPALQTYPRFLETLVERLSSADHALCANSLMLISSLMRDAITATSPEEFGSADNASAPDKVESEDSQWSKFVKRMQDLGVIKAVYVLMQSTALLQDLGHPLLEFQSLIKMLLRKWRDLRVDLRKPEQRRALKSLQVAATNGGVGDLGFGNGNGNGNGNGVGTDNGRPNDRFEQHSEQWRRLGFETESPILEFEQTGFLGLLDLTDYTRKQQDGFVKLLLEQGAQSPEQRCPIARASVAVTLILYGHFEIDRSVDGYITNTTSEARNVPDRNHSNAGSRSGRRTNRSNSKHDNNKGNSRSDIPKNEFYMPIESRTHFNRGFKPLLLQWSRLHMAGLKAFLRLWKDTGAAEEADFEKVEELVMILIESVVGRAVRTTDIGQVEEEIAEASLEQLRALQMEMRELAYEDAWGKHLRQVREELHHEALQFVKEQRIRCLLQGAWFQQLGYAGEDTGGPITQESLDREVPTSWKYVKLSHNRRYVHYATFKEKTDVPPGLEKLEEKVDLSIVTSVVSNVSTAAAASDTSPLSSNPLKKPLPPSKVRQVRQEEEQQASSPPKSQTKITILGLVNQPPSSSDGVSASADAKTSRSRHGQNNTKGTTYKNNTYTTDTSNNHSRSNTSREAPLLTLNPPSQSLASEWLDGLLMLLNQQPITADTNKLIELISGYGLKIRLLNVRLVGDSPEDGDGDGDDDDDGAESESVVDGDGDESGGKAVINKEDMARAGGAVGGADGKRLPLTLKKNKNATGTRMTRMVTVKEPVLPSREGLDEDYYYDIGTM